VVILVIDFNSQYRLGLGQRWLMRASTAMMLAIASMATVTVMGLAQLPVQSSYQMQPTHTSSYQLYHQPHALWLTQDTKVGDNLGELHRALALAQVQHRPPELVVYTIPERDLGESSEGGFATYEQYYADNVLLAEAISRFVAKTKLKPRLYLEPDAIGHALTFRWEHPEMKRAQDTYTQRMQALGYLVKLYSQAGAEVYLDIAHSAWFNTTEHVAQMAQALKEANLQQATGLVTNISNRQPLLLPQGVMPSYTQRSEAGYLQELLTLLPKRHKPYAIVIDTSRNGGAITKPRAYYLAQSGELLDNQSPTGRLVGTWRQDQRTKELWLHPYLGTSKSLTRLLTREKYKIDDAHKRLVAPPWLDPIGDVQLGVAPADKPAEPVVAGANYRYVKPPDECDGSLNCPPGHPKSSALAQTQTLQGARQTPPLPAGWDD
jgi:hypothetical protein